MSSAAHYDPTADLQQALVLVALIRDALLLTHLIGLFLLFIRNMCCPCCVLLSPFGCFALAVIDLLVGTNILLKGGSVEFAFFQFVGAAIWTCTGFQQQEREKRLFLKEQMRENNPRKPGKNRRFDVPMTAEAVAERMRNRWAILEKKGRKHSQSEMIHNAVAKEELGDEPLV